MAYRNAHMTVDFWYTDVCMSTVRISESSHREPGRLSLSKQRLSQRLGAVSERTIESVEDQIKIVLDLHPWSFSADRGHLTP